MGGADFPRYLRRKVFTWGHSEIAATCKLFVKAFGKGRASTVEDGAISISLPNTNGPSGLPKVARPEYNKHSSASARSRFKHREESSPSYLWRFLALRHWFLT